MRLHGHPMLKFRTKDKLHISKEPGLISWVMLLCVTCIGVTVDYYAIPDHILTHAAFMTGCLILGLNMMETWEDFIMDREENLVTFVSRSWYHGFSMKIPEENVKRFPLNCITSVTVNPNSGIDIMKSDGSFTSITTKSKNNNKCLNKLRKEIATFLHLEKIEYLMGNDKIFYEWDVDPWMYATMWSDNHESDTDTHDSTATQDSQFSYERNLKIISGPS